MSDNELCGDRNRIDSLDDCKKAIEFLKYHTKCMSDACLHVKNIYFSNTENDENYPKGCYQNAPEYGRAGVWNTHNTGAASYKTRPICKKGVQTELITIKSLNVLGMIIFIANDIPSFLK